MGLSKEQPPKSRRPHQKCPAPDARLPLSPQGWLLAHPRDLRLVGVFAAGELAESLPSYPEITAVRVPTWELPHGCSTY